MPRAKAEPKVEQPKVSASKTSGTVEVTKQYTSHGKIVSADHKEKMEAIFYDASIPLARVRASQGLTLQLRPFEFAKVEVSVELPTALPEIADAMTTAWEMCSDEVREQYKSIQAFKKKLLEG